MSQTLDSLPLMRPARIEQIGGERSFRRRLLELGFLPGVEVQVLGAAPMGDPLDVEIRGCRFSMRRAEARAVGVSLEGAARLAPEEQPQRAARRAGA